MYHKLTTFKPKKTTRDIPKPPPWHKANIQGYLLNLRDGDSFVINSEKERRQVLNAVYRIRSRHLFNWVKVRMRKLYEDDGTPTESWRVWMDVQPPDQRQAEEYRTHPKPTIERI